MFFSLTWFLRQSAHRSAPPKAAPENGMADNAGEVDGRLQIIGMIFFLIRVITFQSV